MSDRTILVRQHNGSPMTSEKWQRVHDWSIRTISPERRKGTDEPAIALGH